MFADKNECDKWLGWIQRNTSKRNLMESYDAERILDDETSTDGNAMADNMSNHEMISYVDSHIPVSMRSDYRRFLDGCKLSKQCREKVVSEIRRIAEERYGVNDVT